MRHASLVLGPPVWNSTLLIGAACGALTIVNILIGATTLSYLSVYGIPSYVSPSTSDMTLAGNASLTELAASLALYGLAGFLATWRTRALVAGMVAGMLAGALGAVLATLVNLITLLIAPLPVLTFYNVQLNVLGPGSSVSGALEYILVTWGLAAVIVGIAAGAVLGLLGGALGRTARRGSSKEPAP